MSIEKLLLKYYVRNICKVFENTIIFKKYIINMKNFSLEILI